jgi:hypothetical protein
MKNLSFVILYCISMIGCSKNDSSINAGDEPLNLDASATPLTAKYKHEAVQAYVSALAKGYWLYTISSKDVTIEGQSKEWSYFYGSNVDTVTHRTEYCFMRSYNDSVQFDSVTTGSMLVGAAALPQKWANSDVALSIAEKNGGKQFREKNPNYIISAEVSAGWFHVFTTNWYICYSSSVDKNIQFNIRLNAVTGSVE